ncbi:MAG: hypothetical protein JO004_14610, partial [Methylobacteriaceae bacterium]|nr:hypothetical protein [Methylobacteriaceae bacterium]
AARGEARSAALHRRQEQQRKQPGHEEAERKYHRLFNQGAASKSTGRSAEKRADNATPES